MSISSPLPILSGSELFAVDLCRVKSSRLTHLTIAIKVQSTHYPYQHQCFLSSDIESLIVGIARHCQMYVTLALIYFDKSQGSNLC